MQYNYGKNKEEHPEPLRASVTGSLPTWLKGTLVRNGPGMFTVGETSYNHWFDGLALMHSFAIRDGEVTYRRRYLQGDTYTENMEANRIVVSEMGTMAYPDPSKSILSKAVTFLSHTIPDFTDNCGNNIIRYGSEVFATSETNYIRKIDPETLHTQEKVNYQKFLPANLVISHPHYDREGNTYNMGTCIAEKAKSKYMIFRVPPSNEGSTNGTAVLKGLEVLCSLPCQSLLSPSYYHSFGITDNYFIFFEQPLKLDILKMATAYMRNVNWASCLKFHPKENVVIHVIDRRTRKEVKTRFQTEALVVYHHVNAFEEDGHVVVDVISYEDDSLYNMFYLRNLRGEANLGADVVTYNPKYHRFVLPLDGEKSEAGGNLVKLKSTTASAVKTKDGYLLCKPEELCHGVELPRINYDFNGRKHRYTYLTYSEKPAVPAMLLKLDVETKKTLQWEEENCWPSEAVFIGRPGAQEEDDGVVLTAVISTVKEKSSFLLLLDGKSFTEVARASVDVELHMDMHGYFIPDEL